MDKMLIEIWSDIACPFCYIGKRKLEMALAQFEHSDKVELKWYSYELDPSLPKEAVAESLYQYFADKYGLTLEEAVAKQQGVIKLAKEVGLNYDYDKLKVTSTTDALRLVKLAAKFNLATEAEEVLFRAYFEQGENISDRKILIELGEKIGLKAADIEAMLDSDQYLSLLKKDAQRAEEEFDLQYIPFYRINYNQIIQGSIAVEDYLKVLNQAYAEWESGTSSLGGTIAGQSCSIDGICS